MIVSETQASDDNPEAAANRITGIRESMAVLPDRIQWLLTELTGKALKDQHPPFRWNAAMRFATTMIMLILGITISLMALHAGGIAWILLPIGWLLTTSAMRSFQVVFLHHASHDRFANWLAEVLSISIWIQSLNQYRAQHRKHHAKTATSEDKDLALVVSLGLLPGLTRREYWSRLFSTLLSPQFHGHFAMHRLRSNFTSDWTRTIAATIWTLVLGLWANSQGYFLELAIVWLIPAWPLFQIAAYLSLITEHTWVRHEGPGISPRETISRLTSARFFGERAPAKDASRIAWATWTLRMFMIHLPAKLLAVQGDQHSHDWHHRHPKGDWENAAYARSQSQPEDSSRGWPAYTEVWGLKSALNSTFDALAALPKNSILGNPDSYNANKTDWGAM
jgi:fatty acid desaturase